MSENSEQTAPAERTQQETTVQPISHKRVLLEMAAVAALGSLFGFVFVSPSFGVGVLVGGALSLVNYYWLKRSLVGIFDKAIAGERPQFLATRYFLRYLAFAAVLAVVYLTKTVPVVAVILGMASFALAIIVEAVIRVLSGFFNKKEF